MANPSFSPSPHSGDLATSSGPPCSDADGSSSLSTMELPSPEQLQLLMGDAYVVESFIGRGGMGAVYRGLQMPLRRPVAIKILARGHGADYDFEDRFRREAYAMAQLTHPNVVQVYDFGNAGDDFLFISMEFVECGDLCAALKAGWMTPNVALSLVGQICDGLQAAHESGLVHRDIKPGNIFLTGDCRAKVADFGLAKQFDGRTSIVTRTGLGLGTPDYAAPEQYEDVPTIDHRADIFALGVMMYQMLTGQMPRGTWKAPSARVGTDPRLDDVILKAMESDPVDRYQSVEAMKADIIHITSTPLRRAGAVSIAPLSEPEPILVQVEPPPAPRRPTGPRAPMSRPVTPLPTRLAASPARQSTPRPARESLVSGLIAGLVCLLIVAAAILMPSPAPQAGKERLVQLIDLQDPKGAPLAGQWTASSDGLECKAPPLRPGIRDDLHMRIYDLHYAPPQEYDFEIEFTRTRGSIVQVLSADGDTFVHELRPAVAQATAAVRSGFNGLDGLRMEQATEGFGLVTAPDDGSRHVVTVEVRHDKVRSLLDGKEIAEFRGEISRFALPKQFRLGGENAHLGIASRGGEVIFHRATVREISGPGRFTSPNTAVTDRMIGATGTVTKS